MVVQLRQQHYLDSYSRSYYYDDNDDLIDTNRHGTRLHWVTSIERWNSYVNRHYCPILFVFGHCPYWFRGWRQLRESSTWYMLLLQYLKRSYRISLGRRSIEAIVKFWINANTGMPDAKSADKVKNVEICQAPFGPHQYRHMDQARSRKSVCVLERNKPSSWPHQ